MLTLLISSAAYAGKKAPGLMVGLDDEVQTMTVNDSVGQPAVGYRQVERLGWQRTKRVSQQRCEFCGPGSALIVEEEPVPKGPTLLERLRSRRQAATPRRLSALAPAPQVQVVERTVQAPPVDVDVSIGCTDGSCRQRVRRGFLSRRLGR